MESTCLSSATSPFVVQSLICHFSQPGSLKDSPLLMDHLLALGGCTWKLPVAQVLQPCLWDQTLGCLHLPPKVHIQPICRVPGQMYSPSLNLHIVELIPSIVGMFLLPFAENLQCCLMELKPSQPGSHLFLAPGRCSHTSLCNKLPLASLSINH